MSARTVWTVALNLAAACGLVLLVLRSARVISWLLVALLLALALDPLVRFLERRRFPRTLAVVTTMAAVVLVAGVAIVSFLPVLVDQVRDLVRSGPQLIERLQSWSPFVWAQEHLDLASRGRRWLGSNADTLTAPVLGALTNVLHLVVAAVATFFLTVFMLLFGEKVVSTSLEWISPSERPHARELLRRMRGAIGGYVAGTFVVASIGGVVTTIATLALGVPYFLPLGLAMALLGVIPFIGVIIAAVLVIGVTLATSGVKAAIIVAIVFLVYQQIENHLLQPLVQRRTIKMNPLLITVSLLFGTAAWGILGALLALPAAGALQVVLQDALARRQRRWNASDTTRSGEPRV